MIGHAASTIWRGRRRLTRVIELGRLLDEPDEAPQPGHPILGGGDS